ncbi:hypothetical protein OAY12_00560 [Candidatus Pelagibacter sp.]|nr:hypothetical protein [Candidatus Pelagibacter sp.]
MKLIYRYKLIIITILTLISFISVTKSFLDAQNLSFDFHFSPTKLVAEGVNHYQYILDGKHDHGQDDKLMYDQNGNYAQGLFVILIPFTWFSWDEAKLIWSIINIALSFIIPLILCKKFGLDNFKTFLILSIFLCSTIFRIHISYGQQTLILLIFLILPFLKKNFSNVALSGIAYFKYNIGYGLFLYFLSLKNLKFVSLSLLPLIFGWLSYCYITNTNLITNILEPLRVILYWNSEENHFPVTLFNLLDYLRINTLLTLVLPIFINFYFILKIKKIDDDLKKLSLLCLSILCFTPHQLHDYVLLIPLLVYSLKNFQYLISFINLILIFYFFYFLRILSFIFNYQPWEFPYGFLGYMNNFILILIFLMNIIFLNNNKKIKIF